MTRALPRTHATCRPEIVGSEAPALPRTTLRALPSRRATTTRQASVHCTNASHGLPSGPGPTSASIEPFELPTATVEILAPRRTVRCERSGVLQTWTPACARTSVGASSSAIVVGAAERRRRGARGGGCERGQDGGDRERLHVACNVRGGEMVAPTMATSACARGDIRHTGFAGTPPTWAPGSDVARDDGVRVDDRARADGHAAQDARAEADPRVLADRRSASTRAPARGSAARRRR